MLLAYMNHSLISAELVAQGPLDKLRLADVLGYQVSEVSACALEGMPAIRILVQE